jgi:cobalt-zinc-cadmium efflux system membrane fusion protein
MKRIILCAGLLAALNQFAVAHEGHDHADEKKPAAIVGNTPQRLPDGAVFLPKSAQRGMGVLTLKTAEAELPKTIELPGRVIMDPHLGGRVQAMIPGRIEAAGAHGLPAAGSKVKKGEVLAWVVPSAGAIERSNQAALLAELKASQGLAEKRLDRLRELADTVPKKEIEAAESEVASLKGRLAAVGGGLSGREVLVAPVAGILAASNALVGQVVEPRELIFEIIDPDSLHVEATAYDPLALDQVAAATVALGERSVQLSYVGAPRRLREQALPLIFENHATGAGLTLPLGQPVKVQVSMKSTLRGLPLPMSALTRNTANQVIVWIKTEPERFEARAVQTQPIDGVRVMVSGGLKSGERVVVQGASLISQIR